MPRRHYRFAHTAHAAHRHRGPVVDPSKTRFFKLYGDEFNSAIQRGRVPRFCTAVLHDYLARFGYQPLHTPFYGFREEPPIDMDARIQFAKTLRTKILTWYRRQDPVCQLLACRLLRALGMPESTLGRAYQDRSKDDRPIPGIPKYI
ncbi:hypothetical protein C8F04DRAFT_1267518 [Mycena alexandri]|uniref:Uncharacterized protein n=1 Tax=Mycena alexandri TaxID=1745969 RepID=A0AAD6SIX0_9AGAR|nr:hypothetical protein C8F04DRAFT_1267518 [Mycena alexandri]